jgi:uncharacterized protein
VSVRLVGLTFGVGFGFLMSWAGLSDATVIRNMLLLRETHVFLLMGSAIVVAAVGLHGLRRFRVRALVTGDPIEWTLERPQSRHVLGSVLFGAGWSLAGTCPGPVAAMVGQGRLGGLFVAAGLLAGVSLQGALASSRARASERRPVTVEAPGTAGL